MGRLIEIVFEPVLYELLSPSIELEISSRNQRPCIVCADSVTRGLVRDHPSMNMKIGTLVPGYVLSANLSL